MEQTTNTSANYIGMFDLLKGIGMLFIILGHTVNNYSFANTTNPIGMAIFGVGYLLLGAGIMQAFFLISGYGFRKTKIVSCIKKQSQLILKPYLYIALATSALHILTRFLMSHSLKSAIKQTWSVFGGFLFALPANKVMFGTQFYFCGAVWYIIALFIGWILLNALMHPVKERYLPFVVWVCAALGWFLGKDYVIPFCISQGLIAVFYLYYGYRLKKTKALSKPLSKVQIVLAVLICVVSLGLVAFTGKINNMADGVWILGILSIAFDGYIGYILLRISLKMNSLKGRIWKYIKIIGSNSFYIFAVHTVEIHGIPWWKLTEYMSDRPLLGCVLHFLLRCAFIIIGTLLLKKVVQNLANLKRNVKSKQ